MPVRVNGGAPSWSTKKGDQTSLSDRFWKKVQKGEPEECWPWTGAADKFGRGAIYASPEDKKVFGLTGGKMIRAPRAAMYLSTGKAPDANKCICHTCDNPRCCNPNHLFLGTHKENMEDMVSKSRHRPKLKYDDALIAEARSLRAAGKKLREIQDMTGIEQSYLSRVCRGEGGR